MLTGVSHVSVSHVRAAPSIGLSFTAGVLQMGLAKICSYGNKLHVAMRVRRSLCKLLFIKIRLSHYIVVNIIFLCTTISKLHVM